ncbi:PAS domain-containing hybrid sensor histidine kinase/response regulator [Gemmatimonas groenlandica]|uniref:histidine kinase n=1 Tax=Gemmatimonas groenlandica TaxID=2732249 RepID=A0A6M4IV90_9BACT|nr:PAS domain S-box protein [Gemmatimonas groenlandica]QJR37669.1 PAS domain S-box protein [Gemmatimonas groenlandica]
MPDLLLPEHPSGGARKVLWPILVGMPLALLAVLLAAGRSLGGIELAGPVVLLGAALVALSAVAVGRVRTASTVLILSLIGSGALMVVGYGSIRSIGYLCFIGAVVVAGIFHGPRVLIAALVANIVLVGSLVYAEMHGIMVSLNRPISVFHGLAMSFALALIGFAVHYSRTVAVSAATELAQQLREREQVEATIRQTEERLRLSMEATRQGWFDLDLRTGAVMTSAHFARIMGADPHEPNMSQSTWMNSIHLDDRAAVLGLFEECLRTGDTRQMEYRMRTRTGGSVWIRSIAKVVEWDAQQRPVRMTGTHTDISDQMQVLIALRQSERQYRTLVELSPVAILVQRGGIVLYGNAAATALLGAHGLDDVVGMSLTQFVHPEDRDALLQYTAATPSADVAGRMTELRFVRVDGETLEVSVQCTPITFEGATAVQLNCTDISARKRATETLLRSRQLESLGTLAAGIAHDFNNIILAIRGNAELAALDIGAHHAAADAVTEITRASARASEIVRRITTFARPKTPNREYVALPTLIDEVLKLLRPTIPAGIALHLRTGEPVASVHADAAQLHEALVNLTANAADAIGHREVGAITYVLDGITLDTEHAQSLGLAVGDYVRISVSDTGRGMDTTTMARAFDAFFTTKPIGEGSGLGLSMAYGIVRSHGGALVANSAPGAGTTFRLYLPAASGKAVEVSTADATPAVSTISRRVMYVDDEAQLVRLAQRILSRAGHHAEVFTDPASALERFRQAPGEFDLVVTDLTMPGMSGLQLARAVKTVRAEMPIVMVTGDADATAEAEAEEAGIAFVAVKASVGHQLIGLVERVYPGEA